MRTVKPSFGVQQMRLGGVLGPGSATIVQYAASPGVPKIAVASPWAIDGVISAARPATAATIVRMSQHVARNLTPAVPGVTA